MSEIQLDWNLINTVLLDMDGTLLDLHFDNYFWLQHLPAAYAEKNQLLLSVAQEDLNMRFDTHRGTLQWYCLDFWCRELQMDIPALKLEVQHLIKPREGAIEFLRALKAANKRAVLVTNAHRGSIELKMLRTELGDYLDRIISSHDFGYPKEDQRFWQALEANESFEKSSALFIDDTASVLEAAERYGIQFVLGVLWPDSQSASRAGEHPFPMLNEFAEILPPVEA